MRPVGAFNEPVRAPIMKLVFSRRHVESTPFHPKTKLGFCVMFWSASKTGVKTCPVGALNAPVRAPIINFCFHAKHVQSTPLHQKTKFGYVSHVLVTLKNRPENRPCRCIKCTGSYADYETCVFAPNMSNPLQYNQKPNLGMHLMFWSPSKPSRIRAL